MKPRNILLVLAAAMLLIPVAAIAQVINEPYWPLPPADEGPAHPTIPSHDVLVADYQAGVLSLNDMRRMGLSVFATPFNTYDGLGDGPFDLTEIDTRMPGQRPTLQGQRLTLRINGLDAQSCNECHTIVSNRSRLPTLGLAGVGGIVQNAIIMPTIADIADSMDDRMTWMPGHDPDLPMTFDGTADYSGRYANPPFLYGGGGVELLGKEMTVDLQRILRDAQAAPNEQIFDLTTHGVNFGYLVSEGGGEVNFDHVEGVDHDLVVRPFGRKGEFFSMRDFDQGAMQFHFGIQPVEVVGEGVDADGDGVTNEVTIGELTVLHFFDVANPPPRIALWESAQESAGAKLVDTIGCTACHRPLLQTRGKRVPLAYPQVPEDPRANVYARVNLVDVGFVETPGGGVFVPMFADLKRHDMGDRLAETFEGGAISNREFTTARLWGVSDTAPYLHDGRATTLYQAIWFHGGEAQVARDNFLNLTTTEQRLVLFLLRSLRTPIKPNEDILPLS